MRSLIGLITVITLFSASCNQQMTAEEYMAKGQEYVTTKEWNSAIIEFKNAVKQSPDSSQARTMLGKTYVNIYDDKAAIKELTKAIELGASPNEIMVSLGKAYGRSNQHQKIVDQIIPIKGQTKDVRAAIYSIRAMALLGLNKRVAALEALKKARSLDENSTETRLAWARYEKSNGNVSAQLKWLNPLRKKDGGIPEAWSLIGEIEQAANNLEAAEKAFSRSIELRPYIHYDSVRRAIVKIAREDYEGASADLENLKKAGANWPIVDHAEGLIAYQKELLDEAQSHFTDALSRSPDYSPSQFMLGLVYFRNNNLQSALKHLEQYLATHPDEFRPNFVYASALLQQKNSEKALKILKKLQKMEPDNISILSLLASAYASQRNTEKAAELLGQAVKTQPNNAQLRLQFGTTLLSQASTVKAGQKELIKAIKLNPELHQADLNLYLSYMREKRFDAARAVGRQLDKKQNEHSQGANLVALSYLGEGDKDEAIKLLLETLNRFPEDMLTSGNLGRIYLQQNETRKARELYESILKNSPAHLKSINQLALISAKEGNQKEVIEWLIKARDRNPGLLSPVVLLATQYLRKNEFSKSVQVLAGVNDDQKEQPVYSLLMAQTKIGLEEPQHAIRLLKSIISRNPKISAAHYLLAQAYGKLNQSDLMRASLEKTIKLVPDHLSANIVLANLDLFEGDFESFRKRVNALDTNFPKNSSVQLLKARLASGDKDFKKAIKTLSSLMEDTPRSEVIIDLSQNQWRAGDKGSAISGLELWVQDHSEDSRAVMLLAEFYMAENRFDQAKETYAKLDSQLQGNPVALNNLAWLIKDSDPAQGVIYAKKALSLMPDNPFIKDTLAMLYLETGDKDNALQLSKEAVAAMPGLLDIQLNYATILNENNFKTKAQNVLKKLLKNTKSDIKKKLIRDHMAKLSKG